MKKLTTLYLKRFNHLNESDNANNNDSDISKSWIPGDYVVPEDSPFKNLNECEWVEGPDGVKYLINDGSNRCLVIKFKKCKKAIGSEYPALSYFADMLDTIVTFDIPTMATDGLRLFVNPAFSEELLAKTGALGFIFVIIHELYHNLFLHLIRAKNNGFDMRRSNVAGDYEINLAIEEMQQEFQGITKTIGGLIDIKYAKKAFEDIYRELDKSDQFPVPPLPKKQNSNLIKLDPQYKDGYKDGWNKAIEEAAAQGIVFGFGMNESKTYKSKALLEMTVSQVQGHTGNPYDDGFMDGYSKCWNKIKALQQNPVVGGDGGGTKPDGPQVEQIDGLKPIKPTFQVQAQGNANDADSGPNNEPIEIPTTSQIQQSVKDNKDKFGSKEYDKNGNLKNDSGSSGSGQGSNSSNGTNQQNQNGQQSQGGSSSQNGQAGGDPNGSGQQNQNGQQSQGGSSSQNGQAGGDPNGTNQQAQGGIGNSSSSSIQKPNNGIEDQFDPTSDMKKITKVSTGYGKGQKQYVDGKEVNGSGRDGQAGYGDLISKEMGDQIEMSDGTWNRYKAHSMKNSDDVQRIWERALKSERGRQLIDELRKHGLGTADVLEKMINDMEPPTQDWKRILKRYLIHAYRAIRDKFPKKKKVDMEIYKKYQKTGGRSGKDIVYLIDVSGSMSKDDLQDCLREINALAEQVDVRRAYIFQCDTEIKLESADIIKPSKKSDTKRALSCFVRYGMGGTDFKQPFKWLSTEFIKERGVPECVIVMTDGGVDIPPKPKKWGDKVIWFIVGGYTGFDPGYGKVLYYKGNKQ